MEEGKAEVGGDAGVEEGEAEMGGEAGVEEGKLETKTPVRRPRY